MTVRLDADQLLRVAAHTAGGAVRVRDRDALDVAVRAPGVLAATADGTPDLYLEAAALLDAIATHRPLAAGNLRLAWGAVRVTLYLNGVPAKRVEPALADDLVHVVADGGLVDLRVIATRLRDICR